MIYTFYSYKGGVGRSMALANIAEWFYLKGKKVILVDWDLEAPGLEGYFCDESQIEEIKTKKGLINILADYKKQYAEQIKRNDKLSAEISLIAEQISSASQTTEESLPAYEELLSQYAAIREEDIEQIITRLQQIKELSISQVAAIIREKVSDENLLDKISLGIYDKLFGSSDNYNGVRDFLSDFSILSNDAPAAIAREINILQLESRLNPVSAADVLQKNIMHIDAEQWIEKTISHSLNEVLYEIHKPTESNKGGLWLLSAGKRDGQNFTSYSEAVQDFRWLEFYTLYKGDYYFDLLKKQLESKSDIVMIDSRTGVSEMSGVSTRQMADVIVAITAPNYQNLTGTSNMLLSFINKNVIEARKNRPLKIVVVPSRIDSSEISERNKFEASFYRIIDTVLANSQSREFWKLGIPYVPRYIYNDELAIGISSDPSELEMSTKAAELDLAFRKIGAYLLEENFVTDTASVEKETQVANPFIGIRAYTAEEAASFFGRKEEIQKAVELIEKSKIVIISGPSGSGKTSLIKAGIIPELNKRHANQNDVIYFSGSPKTNLNIPSNPGGIVIEDQVETMFTPDNNINTTDFSDKINRQKELCKCQVFSVRSEYLQQLINLLGKNYTADVAIIKVGYISNSELQEIIRELVKKARLKLEPGLMERIIKDCESFPVKLPVLQYTLSELWQEKQYNILTHAAYDKIGQVEGAARMFLRKNLQGITAETLQQALPIIARLVNAETFTRQQAGVNEFSNEEINKIKPFLDLGVITITHDTKTYQDTMQLSHDLLVNEWTALNDWIFKNREFLMWRQRLNYSKTEWFKNKEDESLLLSGYELSASLSWLSQKDILLSSSEADFIESSKELAEKKRKQIKIQRAYAVLIPAVFILLFVSFSLYKEAREKKAVLQKFKDALVDIDNKTGEEKTAAICTLSGFDNIYDDNYIRLKKDTLQQTCIDLRSNAKAAQSIIDSSEQKIDSLSNKALRSGNTGAADYVDKLEQQLNIRGIQIQAAKDRDEKQKLKNDSMQISQQIDKIIKTNTILDEASKTSKVIETYQQKQNQGLYNSNSSLLFQQSTWFKKNYFLQFENLRILLLDLSKSNQSITIEICNITGAGPCNSPATDVNPVIQLNKPYSFQYGGFQYNLSLDRIGAAGRNPFTAGAYITFTKSKLATAD